MASSDPAFLSSLFGSLRSGLLAIDTAGTVVAMNPEARRILGASATGCWIGRDCREVLAGQPVVSRVLLEALDGRDRPSRAELTLAASPGQPARSVGFTLTTVRDADAVVCGAAIVFRDLTPIERMDEQERLRGRLAALGEMAAGLAHELRNPLASLEVLAGLLQRQLADRPDELELIAELRGALRTLTTTVNASLDFVKPAVPARVEVDVCGLVDEALAQAQVRVPFEGEVERVYTAGAVQIPADPDQLRAVLTNLIVNAFQAMTTTPGPGRLRLEIALRALNRPGGALRVAPAGALAPEPESTELTIVVADDGPGVPAELRERIFYPFFTTRDAGSGVGLALAAKLVASHGGCLELDPGDGPGAVFRLCLPLTGDAQ